MKNINDEYMLMSYNHTDERLDNYVTMTISPKMWLFDLDQNEFYTKQFNRPLEFRIDNFSEMEAKHGRVEKVDYDFLFDGVYGLLIADRHKEFFMLNLNQSDVKLHKAILLGERKDEKNSIYEGYWLLPTPHRPLDWVDLEKSDVIRRREEPNIIHKVDSVELKESVDQVELKERMIFNIANAQKHSCKTYFMYPFVHKSIVKYLEEHDKEEQLLFLTTKEVHEDPGSLFN